MKKNLMRGALACLALVMLGQGAAAGQIDAFIKLDGVKVTVRTGPEAGGRVVLSGQTDADGRTQFPGLGSVYGSILPGIYMVEIDGKSLITAMDRLHPPITQKQSSDSGASLSAGGLFGSGGGHSEHNGHGSHGGSGGVGLGLSVPLGGKSDPGPSAEPVYFQQCPTCTIVIVADLPAAGTNNGTHTVSVGIPYCRDGAGQGIRIGFTIPDHASSGNLAAKPVGVTLSISDQGASGNHSSF